MKTALTRHENRVLALQGLFAREFNLELTTNQILTQLIEFEERLTTKSNDNQEQITTNIPDNLTELIAGVLEHLLEIDQIITENLLSSWKMERIAKVDLITLRIAIFEIKYYEATPPLVAINEAVELAKEFNDDQGGKFVNGVLANLIK